MKVRPGDVVVLLVLSGLTAALGAAARRQAWSMGLPPLAVAASGALATTAVSRALRRR